MMSSIAMIDLTRICATTFSVPAAYLPPVLADGCRAFVVKSIRCICDDLHQDEGYRLPACLGHTRKSVRF